MGKVISFPQDVVYAYAPGEAEVAVEMIGMEKLIDEREEQPDGLVLARMVSTFLAENKATLKREDYIMLVAIGAELMHRSEMMAQLFNK